MMTGRVALILLTSWLMPWVSLGAQNSAQMCSQVGRQAVLSWAPPQLDLPLRDRLRWRLRQLEDSRDPMRALRELDLAESDPALQAAYLSSIVTDARESSEVEVEVAARLYRQLKLPSKPLFVDMVATGDEGRHLYVIQAAEGPLTDAEQEIVLGFVCDAALRIRSLNELSSSAGWTFIDRARGPVRDTLTVQSAGRLLSGSREEVRRALARSLGMSQ